jgi:hypothetical protein
MISDGYPLDWDMLSLPISQLVEVLLAWRGEDQILPETLNGPI